MSTEERVAKIEAILPTLATKEDLGSLRTELHQSLTTMTIRVVGWTIGWSTALVSITYFVASSAGHPPAPQAPIVITVPAQASPPAPAVSPKQ
jgi:hypothetical protein